MTLTRRQLFASAGAVATVAVLPLPVDYTASAGNSILSVDMIIREALEIAHRRTAFVLATNRQYDKAFAALNKTVNHLRVRRPRS